MTGGAVTISVSKGKVGSGLISSHVTRYMRGNIYLLLVLGLHPRTPLFRSLSITNTCHLSTLIQVNNNKFVRRVQEYQCSRRVLSGRMKRHKHPRPSIFRIANTVDFPLLKYQISLEISSKPELQSCSWVVFSVEEAICLLLLRANCTSHCLTANTAFTLDQLNCRGCSI